MDVRKPVAALAAAAILLSSSGCVVTGSVFVETRLDQYTSVKSSVDFSNAAAPAPKPGTIK